MRSRGWGKWMADLFIVGCGLRVVVEFRGVWGPDEGRETPWICGGEVSHATCAWRWMRGMHLDLCSVHTLMAYVISLSPINHAGVTSRNGSLPSSWKHSSFPTQLAAPLLFADSSYCTLPPEAATLSSYLARTSWSAVLPDDLSLESREQTGLMLAACVDISWSLSEGLGNRTNIRRRY